MVGVLPGIVAVLLMSVGVSGQTNGFVLQCLSARTSGQGCVTRGQGDAPTSLFRDPAGLVSVAERSLELNAAPFMPALTFRNGANAEAVDGRNHTYPMASFAYVGRKIGKLAWAVGMEPIGGFGSDFQLRHDLLSGGQGRLIDYESFFAAAKFGPAVAYELFPGFSVGGSVSGVYALIRDFRMPFSMSPSAARGMAGIPQLDPAVYGPLFQQFTELTAYGDSEGYGGLTWTADAGIAYRSPSGFAFSASWSPERAIEVDGGSAVIDMSAQFDAMLGAMVAARMQAYGTSQSFSRSVVLQQLAAAGLDLQAGMTANYQAATTITLPMTVGAGVSLPLGGAVRLAGELEWRRWSEAEDVMPFELTAGDNQNINIMMNGDGANGDFTYPFPLHWQDALSAKLGATWSLAGGHALRAGFMYGENPVPDHTVFITFPAISTRAVTFGGTLNVGRLPLDVSFVRALEQDLAGCSDGHAIGSEYLNSRTTMSENVVTVGTVLRFR
jgi:long-chain fatty acid transport protein